MLAFGPKIYFSISANALAACSRIPLLGSSNNWIRAGTSVVVAGPIATNAFAAWILFLFHASWIKAGMASLAWEPIWANASAALLRIPGSSSPNNWIRAGTSVAVAGPIATSALAGPISFNALAVWILCLSHASWIKTGMAGLAWDPIWANFATVESNVVPDYFQ